MADLTSFSHEAMTVEIDYVGGDFAIFIGEAMPGTLTSVAKWRIKKLTYDGSNHVTKIQWANAEAISFTVEWDDRASLTYT